MLLNSLGLNKAPSSTKVCVAMSGGVDSSATAYLLKQAGYDVFGMTMDLLQAPYAPAQSSIADAAKVAKLLDVPHYLLDMKAAFATEVVNYFTETYIHGQTPSPCIMCNRQIKLGLLADKAKELGADIIVTGHYADIRLTEHGVELHKGSDHLRDQSYFLFAIAKETLQILRCPLAHYSKEQTRAIAREIGLEIAQKADSQDICFVQNGKYSQLISQLRPDYQNQSGNIIDRSGKVLGQHRGIINYTIGQRRGLGIGGGDALYVLGLDVIKNQVIVGAVDELNQSEVKIRDINWLGEKQPSQLELMVKLRSRQEAVPATVIFQENNTAILHLAREFAGVAPGQGCCFYDDTRVLGGGFIEIL